MDYFSHPYMSNSKLSSYARELGLIQAISDKNQYDNYRLGTLFDLLITEPERLDRLNGRMIGTDYSFTKEEYDHSSKMADSFYKSDIYKKIKPFELEFQKEIYDENFKLFGLPVPFKAKLDIYLPGWVLDIKTTDATSQSQFENSCELFGYYRQMYLYKKLTGSVHSTLIGVSKKKPHKVFEVHFNEKSIHYRPTEVFLKTLLQRIYLAI